MMKAEVEWRGACEPSLTPMAVPSWMAKAMDLPSLGLDRDNTAQLWVGGSWALAAESDRGAGGGEGRGRKEWRRTSCKVAEDPSGALTTVATLAVVGTGPGMGQGKKARATVLRG